MSAKHRPLSGNVYLKKTIKNGWVACSVHDEEEERWGEAGLDDDWEDEGEGWGSQTVLDGLLKSKKLMNSKQVSHSLTHWVTLRAVPAGSCTPVPLCSVSRASLHSAVMHHADRQTNA